MQLKTKILAPLFVILLMGMANSAFANVTCAASVQNLRNRETINIITGVAGDIVLTCNALDTNQTTAATISISYGLPITNHTAAPATHSIQVIDNMTDALVTLDPGVPGTQGAINGLLLSAGTISLAIPPFTPAAVGAAGNIVVQNVLLSLAGGTVANQDVKANINVASQNNTFNITGAPVTVIGQVLPSINSTTSSPGLTTGTLTAQFTSTGGTINNTRSNFSITVTENYIDAWRTAGDFYAPQGGNGSFGVLPQGTDVTFTFSGMLPGSLIQNCVASISPLGNHQINLTGSGIAGQNGQATLTVELANGFSNLAQIEALTLNCGSGTAAPAYGVGTSTGAATTNVSFSVSQSPIGVNYPGPVGTVSANAAFPRYLAGTSVPGVTVIGFTGATTGQTTLILPWGIASGAAAPPAGTFDTGVVIANTTKNSAAFATPAEGGATAASGNITFTFFPGDGSASFSVTPTTGFGLQTGVIPSGGSFIANLSEIMKVGGQTGNFSGYVIITANFTHAHGSAFVYGGNAITNRIATNQSLLVIGNPGFQPRDLLGTLPNAELVTH